MMASSCSISMKTLKAKGWTLAEESKLVTLVVANEELLYGNYKGAGAEKVSVLRKRKWEEIASTINKLVFSTVFTGIYHFIILFT